MRQHNWYNLLRVMAKIAKRKENTGTRVGKIRIYERSTFVFMETCLVATKNVILFH